MNAIVEISGKQYSIREGDRLKVSSQSSDVGAMLTFDHILFANDGKKDHVGTPTVKGAVVQAKVLEHGRDRKILIFKKKRRKGYQRKNGHRQGYTLLQIDKIKFSATTKKTVKKSAEKTSKEE
ncbi:MAG: 50S ribosomal protein L21 [Fidelibacterota bacterium]